MIPANHKLDKLADLKNKLETAKRDKAEAEGAVKETLRRLQAEYGCNTIASAEAKLKAMDTQIKTDEAAFLAALEQFETEFGDPPAQSG